MTRSFLPATYLALLAVFATLPGRAEPADGADEARFHLTAIALLMPEASVGKRIAVDDLVSLTDTIVAEANHWAVTLDAAHAADDCTVFIAVRPGQRLKTWTSCRSFDGGALDAQVAHAVDGTRIPTTKGLVVYSIYGKNAGREAFPEPWKVVLDGKQSEVPVSAIVDKVWPE